MHYTPNQPLLGQGAIELARLVRLPSILVSTGRLLFAWSLTLVETEYRPKILLELC